MLCASCAEKPVLVLPPAELADCSGEPTAPDLPAIDWSSVGAARPIVELRDGMMLAYALAFRTAWGDCKADTEALGVWRKEAAD